MAGATEAEYRPLLFSIAYGMTGAVGDAEDIVQDALLGLTRARPDGRVLSVFALDITGGLVQAIRAVVNPDKLGHLGPVSDLGRLPGNGS